MNEIVTQKESWDREAETMIGIGSFDYVKEPLPILKEDARVCHQQGDHKLSQSLDMEGPSA